MENITPQTLFTGQQLIYLPECDSTNTVAHHLLSKNEATEGCVVICSAQQRGRGQRGNSWEADPDRNITLSVILSPTFLAARHQFYLNMAVSLAVRELVQELLPGTCTVKWPNDIYFQDKKLGGILIENTLLGASLQHSIIGIGLNVNQSQFVHPRAVSLSQISGKTYEPARLVERLLEKIEKRYLELRQSKFEKLKYEYLQHLYRYQEWHLYKVGSETLPGQIMGVDEAGKLAVDLNGQLQYFDLKEIAFVFDEE